MSEFKRLRLEWAIAAVLLLAFSLGASEVRQHAGTRTANLPAAAADKM